MSRSTPISSWFSGLTFWVSLLFIYPARIAVFASILAMHSDSCCAVEAQTFALGTPSQIEALSRTDKGRSPVFKGLEGPVGVTALPLPLPDGISQFTQPGSSSLAILLTGDAYYLHPWLALVEGLKAAGVPVTVTTDWQAAFTHAVVVVYPQLAGLPPAAREALSTRPPGSLVLAFGRLPVWAEALTGTNRGSPTLQHHSLSLSQGRTLRLGCFPTVDYVPLSGQVVAKYGNGQAAAITNGNGTVMMLGLDPGAYASLAFNARQSGQRCEDGQGIATAYANHSGAYADRLFAWIKGLYRSHDPLAVTLSAVPNGKAIAVVVMHDVDSRAAITGVTEFSAWETAHALPATYFIQTKYMLDWEDWPFFDQKAVSALKLSLASPLFEVGSESVAHSGILAEDPLGSGQETYPSYRPLATSKTTDEGVTILGELRVSKYLLQSLLHRSVTAFQPGYLQYPESLPQALQATGYTYSSATTADDVLTRLPVHLHFSRGINEEVHVYDLPLSYAGDAGDLPPTVALQMAQRALQAHSLFAALIPVESPLGQGGASQNLALEKTLVAALKSKAWFGTVAQYGQFWRARNAVALSATRENSHVIHLGLKAPRALSGLTLDLPAGWQAAPSPWITRVLGHRVVLGPISGAITLELQR